MGNKSSLRILMVVLAAVAIPPFIQNCSNVRDVVSGASAIPTAVKVVSAGVEECPNGGVVYMVFQDGDVDGVLDKEESVLNSQLVCNGSNGHSSLISTQRISTDLAACVSGSGIQINFGLDRDDDSILQASEIKTTQVICDGQAGNAGAAGAAGSNGHSMVFQVTSAAAEICPAGGSVVLMALDTVDAGVYSPLLPNQQSLSICNGQNGQNAPASAYQPVEPIMPCGNTVAYKEVLLRLANGQVLASFSENANGKNTRLTLVPDGSYVDTDGSHCAFSLNTSADRSTRSISWLGQVQLSWAMPQ